MLEDTVHIAERLRVNQSFVSFVFNVSVHLVKLLDLWLVILEKGYEHVVITA